jgi:hypothetical protein
MKKLLILSIFSGGLLAQAQTVIIRAGTVLDGRGGVLRNTEVAVQKQNYEGRIVARQACL